MKVVADFHPPTSVVYSVKCNLTNDGVEHLVVAKTNRLEVYSLHPDGLRLECELEIWGQPIGLRVLPRASSQQCNLLLMTDHPNASLMVLYPQLSASGTLQLLSNKAISLHERSGTNAEFCNTVVVDEAGEVAVANAYKGRLRVVLFKDGKDTQNFDVIVPELNILSICFIPTSDNALVVGILHRDVNLHTQLLARDLNTKRQQLTLSDRLPPTLLSATAFPALETPPHLAPLRPSMDDADAPFPGGVLVLSGRRLLVYAVAEGEARKKHASKLGKLDKRKASMDAAEARKAQAKEREGKKRKPDASVDWPWGEVTAWCDVGDDSTKFLVGDIFGRLALLVYDLSDRGKLFLMPLGQASSPTTLSYLTNQVVYIGSHYGDSQLIRLSSSPLKDTDQPTLPIPVGLTTTPLSRAGKGKARTEDVDMEEDAGDKRVKGQIIETKGSYIEVLETFPNLAPIVDAALLNSDGSGQPQIVTCSGGQNTGSLKVVRKGAEFEELAVVEGLSHVVDVWPLRAHHNDQRDRFLVASTPSTTHFFELDDGEGITPLRDSSSFSSQRTLIISNMRRRRGKEYTDSGLVVQVTETEVVVTDYDETLGTHAEVGRWTPDQQRRIVGASISASQVTLALTEGIVIVGNLRDTDDRFNVAREKTVFPETGISAISCTPLDPSKNFTTLIAVASWTTNVVEILRLSKSSNSMEMLCRTEPLPSLPRSLLLYNFGRGQTRDAEDHMPHLLIGLSDGNLVTYSLEDRKTLRDRRMTSLGTTPVTIVPTMMDGRPAVCACGTRASFFFYGQGRIQNSPILANGVVTAARVNSSVFPSNIVMATSSALIFGRFRNLDRTYIRSIDMGYDTPRNLAHVASARVFGVTCTRTSPVRVGDAPRMTEGVIKLIDDNSFQVLDQFRCFVGDEFTAIAAVEVTCADCPPTVFAAGAIAYEEVEPSNGQLLILNAEPNGPSGRRFVELASAQVLGCIYAITSLNGLIVAAVDSSVMLFRLEKDEGMTRHLLTKVTEWNHNYFVTSLATFPSGDRLAAGDALHSLSVLTLENDRLVSLPRPFNPLWPVALSVIDAKGVIGSNSDCNLFSYKVARGLEDDGLIYLGDFTTKFLPGAISASSGDNRVLPKQLFFASSGRIGVISVIRNTALGLQLTSLQRNLAYVIKGAGGAEHSSWRAPANSRGRTDAQPAARGFIDGRFLEKWLDYEATAPELARIREGSNAAEQLNMSHDEIRAVLEAMQSLH